MKELGRLALERVPDELKDPAEDEERDWYGPQPFSRSVKARKSGNERTISGIPSVWHRRFTGCW
jgi:hypothetical protein